VDGDSVQAIADSTITVLSNQALAREMGEQGKMFAATLTHAHIFHTYQHALSQFGI
jgi:hypothetical protein